MATSPANKCQTESTFKVGKKQTVIAIQSRAKVTRHFCRTASRRRPQCVQSCNKQRRGRRPPGNLPGSQQNSATSLSPVPRTRQPAQCYIHTPHEKNNTNQSFQHAHNDIVPPTHQFCAVLSEVADGCAKQVLRCHLEQRRNGSLHAIFLHAAAAAARLATARPACRVSGA